MKPPERFDRRDLLSRGAAVFGLAAGAQLGSWVPPALFTLAPPAALAGSGPPGPGRSGSPPWQSPDPSGKDPRGGSVTWQGPRQVVMRKSQSRTDVVMWLVGRNVRGRLVLSATAPANLPPGLSVQVTVRPGGVQFTGRKQEAYPVTYTYRIAGDKSQIGPSLDLDFTLSADTVRAVYSSQRRFRLSLRGI